MNGDKMEAVIREIKVKSILSKSNLPVCEYSVNPYVGCTHGCRYCYASFMKRFTGHQESWGTFLDVKFWSPIKNPQKYAGKEIFVGSVTDPYHPQEESAKRTRVFLEEMQGSGAKLSIQTKSDLVLRDMDLLKRYDCLRVGFSINTLDEDFRQQMDSAVSIERRLAAMRKLHEAGIRTTCFISPIFPGITNVKAIIEEVKGYSNLIWLENLNLRGSFKTDILAYIKEYYPKLSTLYDEIYHHRNRIYWEELDRDIKDYTSAANLPYVRNDDSMKHPFNAPPTVVNFFYHEEIKKRPNR